MTLQTITEKLSARIAGNDTLAGKAVIFDFGADGLIRIDGSQTPATVDNADGPADCRILLSMSDFVEIVSGEQNPQMAFMMGKLKVEGDMSIAMQLGQLLG